MQYPKYSIVIPAFNESARILATLESVVSCVRERGWSAEVIVVNDGSTDAHGRDCAGFARSAPEVRMIENPPTGARVTACAPACLQAQGEVVLVHRRRPVGSH